MYNQQVVGLNGRWVPRIGEMLDKRKPALIIVGLHHFAGPDSILARVREQGLRSLLFKACCPNDLLWPCPSSGRFGASNL
jgi:hypothetical protein